MQGSGIYYGDITVQTSNFYVNIRYMTGNKNLMYRCRLCSCIMLWSYMLLMALSQFIFGNDFIVKSHPQKSKTRRKRLSGSVSDIVMRYQFQNNQPNIEKGDANPD